MRTSAAAVAAFGLYAVLSHIQPVMTQQGASLLDAVIETSRNFGVLLAFATFLVFGWIAVARGSSIPVQMVTSLAVSVTLMGFSYHFLFTDLSETHGLPVWQDELIHTGLTLVVVLWWSLFVPKGDIDFMDLPAHLLLPLLYSVYAQSRGLFEGVYAYDFMDPRIDGGVTVFLSMIFMACITIVIGIGFILLSRFANLRP